MRRKTKKVALPIIDSFYLKRRIIFHRMTNNGTGRTTGEAAVVPFSSKNKNSTEYEIKSHNPSFQVSIK
jgi:hypothetical protein